MKALAQYGAYQLRDKVGCDAITQINKKEGKSPSNSK